MGNRAQVLHQFFAVHTDAAVADRDGFGITVCLNANRQFAIRIDHIGLGQHLELDTVERIGCVGNQFAQKYFAVGVERMGQNI